MKRKVGRPTSSYQIAPLGEKWCKYGEHFAPTISFRGKDNYCTDCRSIYNRKNYLKRKGDRASAVIVRQEIEALCTCGELLSFTKSGSWTCPSCGKDWTAVVKARIDSE